MNKKIDSQASEASLHILSGLLKRRHDLLPILFTELGDDFQCKLPDDDGLIAQQILSQERFDAVALAGALGDKLMMRLRQSQASVYAPKNGDILEWCNAVKLNYLRDKQSRVMRTGLEKLSNGGSPDEVLNTSLQQLEDLTNLQDGRLLVDKGQVSSRLIEQWEGVITGKRLGFLPTGLDSFDTRLGGIPLGDKLILCVGIPGSGKTAFCSQLAWKTAESLQKYHQSGVVVFFTAEASADEIIEREAARRARINLDALEKGEHSYSDDELKLFLGWIDELSTWQTIHLCDKPGLKPSAMPHIIMQAKLKANADFVALTVFDHIQKFAPDSPADGKTDRIETTYSDLQASLKRFACPKLVIAHQNRDSEKRGDPRPSTSDVAYAGEKAADRILFFFLPHQYHNNMNQEVREYYGLTSGLLPVDYEKACIHVTKSRRGRGYQEIDELKFEGRFYNWDKSTWKVNRNE